MDATSTSRTLFGVSSTLPPRYRQATLMSCAGSGGSKHISVHISARWAGRQGGTWGRAASTRDGGQAAHKRVVAHERFGLVKLVEKDKRGVDARDIAAQRRRQWSRLAAGSGGSPGCSPARAPCLMASCESCAQLSWAQGKETQGSRARKEAHMLRRCPVSMMVVIAVCLMAATCSAFKPSRKEGERRCILSHSAQGGSAHAAMLVRVWKHEKGNHDRRW